MDAKQLASELWKIHATNNPIGFTVMDDIGFTESFELIYKQALEDAAALCDSIAADYTHDHYRDHAAGADNCAEKIRAKIDN